MVGGRSRRLTYANAASTRPRGGEIEGFPLYRRRPSGARMGP
jgi:hypothetical protein